MAIYLIDKIQQKNDGEFYLVDAEDVEYNGKSIVDALKAGDIVATTGQRGSTWTVGAGAPTSTDALPGDMYLDSETGEVWQAEGGEA